jgi:chaperonin GroES
VKIKPLRERILVERIEVVEEKSGGIIIPDTAKEKPQRGKIIALGTGKLNTDGENIPWDVKEGDEVLFGKYSGTDIQIDGKEFLFIDEDDILAIL